MLAFAFGEHTVTTKHAGLALTRDGFKAMVLNIKKMSQVISIAHCCISSGRPYSCCMYDNLSDTYSFLQSFIYFMDFKLHLCALPCKCYRPPDQGNPRAVSSAYCDGRPWLEVPTVLAEQGSSSSFPGPSRCDQEKVL